LVCANRTVGTLGIKVWICNGERDGKQDLTPNAGIAANAQAPAQNGRQGRNDRGNRRGGRGPRKDAK
ncbi:MAG: 30S ribosomal protein S3, partial [Bacteroidales bacterium]|nr:30S ribosomal protein S3 [Bacteroidales bacterium]